MRLIELFSSPLLEGYKEATQEFTAASDPATAANAINKYKTLVTKNQVAGQERNIDHWRKQGWDNFLKFINGKSETDTATQIKRKKVPGRSITIREDDNWLIVVPLDKNASCFHGKDSNWCTTKTDQNYFNDYFHDKNITLIYCLQKGTGGMWALATHKDLISDSEIFDKNDKSITDAEFRKQTGLDLYELCKLVNGDVPTTSGLIDTARKDRKKITNQVYELMKDFDGYQRDPALEKKIQETEDPALCRQYILVLWEANRKQKISNYPEKLALIAATDNNYSVPVWRMVTDESEKVHIVTLKHSPDELADMLYAKYEPSEAAQLAAVTADGSEISNLLQYDIEPSKEVIYAAVLNDPSIAGYLSSPHPDGADIEIPQDLQLQVLEKHGKMGLKYFRQGDFKVYRKTLEAALKLDPTSIEYMALPDSALQMMAIELNPSAYGYIRNPTPNVKAHMAHYNQVNGTNYHTGDYNENH